MALIWDLQTTPPTLLAYQLGILMARALRGIAGLDKNSGAVLAANAPVQNRTGQLASATNKLSFSATIKVEPKSTNGSTTTFPRQLNAKIWSLMLKEGKSAKGV